MNKSLKVKLLIVFIVLVSLSIISFISGALGNALFGNTVFSNLFSVSKPHPKLPAEVIFHTPLLSITNTLLASWITLVVLGLLAFASTSRLKLIPGRLQNIMEIVIETLFNFVESVCGKENARKFFPVIATIFLFVITNALLCLLPGFGSIIIGSQGERIHLLRPANTDINLPLALAVASFIFVEYIGISSQGFLHYMSKFINVKKFFYGIRQFFKGKIKTGLNNLFTGLIDMFVGILETMSELIRLISFTFRLFGNMTAGEILLMVTTFLVPWIMPIPFYGLELLVGFVQALIFSGLTLVFATIAASPHEEH